MMLKLSDVENEIWVDDFAKKEESSSTGNDHGGHKKSTVGPAVTMVQNQPFLLHKNPIQNDVEKGGKLECSQLTAEEEEGEEEEEEEEQEEEEEEEVELPDDVYSMIYLCPWYSSAFFYALAVCAFQVVILLLILDDLTYDEDSFNSFNFPPTTTTTVSVAQFMALMIAVFSQDDVTQSLIFISIGLGEEFSSHQSTVLQEKYPGAATLWQYWMANIMRLGEGIFTILVSLVFTIQSETVLDIFLNFAAIEFVSELDNLGFQLAQEGWFGRSLQATASDMSGETLPAKRGKGCIDYFNQILLAVIVAGLFACNAVVIVLQQEGHYIQHDACSLLGVRFGDEVYNLPNLQVAFESSQRNGTTFFKGSTRTVPPHFNLSDPPDLHYAYFSGKYNADFKNKAGIGGQRPVYYEELKSDHVEDFSHDDSSLGFFYYCEGENAWVWTVRALLDAGAIPQKTVERCEYGWLIRSPITEAVTLEEAPMEGWRIWTGVLGAASELSFHCLECNTDIDCGLDRGICGEDNVCHCHEYAAGDFCNQNVACPDLLSFYDDPIPLGSYHSYGYFGAYDRPVYILDRTLKTEYELIFFSGRRWIIYRGNRSELGFLTSGHEHASTNQLLEWALEIDFDLHGYWFSAALQGDYWFSEATEAFLPTGSINWYKFDEARAGGDYGPLGRQIQIPLHLSCLSVDCDSSSQVCGKFGTCIKEQILELPHYEQQDQQFENTFMGQAPVGGKCHCDKGYYGHFCDYKLEGGMSKEDPSSQPSNQTNEEL